MSALENNSKIFAKNKKHKKKKTEDINTKVYSFEVAN